MSFPKTKPPHNVRVLHRWIGEYARANGQAESRLKRTIDYMLVALALDRARDDAGQRMFAIKGGVSMELRLPRAARATQDLDAVFLGAFEAWLESLDDVLEEPVKTAIAAAYLLAQREDVELIGLTSDRNVAFVEGLGVYDRAVAYDAIDSLDREPATFVDVAGDGVVRRAVHEHLGDRLVHSMMVGMTHWEALQAGAAGGELPGPAPTFFFAPDRVARRSADWGPAELERRVADAWHPFCTWTAGWLEPLPGEGFDAVRDAWLDVVEGRVEPDQAHVLALG